MGRAIRHEADRPFVASVVLPHVDDDAITAPTGTTTTELTYIATRRTVITRTMLAQHP